LFLDLTKYLNLKTAGCPIGQLYSPSEKKCKVYHKAVPNCKANFGFAPWCNECDTNYKLVANSMGADSCVLVADIADYSLTEATTPDDYLHCDTDNTTKYWNHTSKKCLCIHGVDADNTTCRTDGHADVCDAFNCDDCTANTCVSYLNATPTHDSCFALNAVLDTISAKTGCKCMPGFKVIYNELNEWRCDRTADIARTNCDAVAVSGSPAVKFSMTELDAQISA
jgi:hypothetical protein